MPPLKSRKRVPLRVLYVAGPGNVIGTYRQWREGRDDPSQVAQTYSGQFFSACRDLGCVSFVIASYASRGLVEEEPFRIEHRPDPTVGTRGLVYHLLDVSYLFGLIVSAVRFRADVVVVGATHYWFLLGLLPLVGIKVVPTMHCTLWPKYWRPRGLQAWLVRLNGFFFRYSASAVLCVSDEVAGQVRAVAGGHPAPIFPFLPTYNRETFPESPPPPSPPFRICYSGRVERDKGVFTLLEMSQDLVTADRRDVEFHICGEGGALAELRHEVEKAGLADGFHFHGHLDSQAMVDLYQSSHLIVVPTMSDFAEGLNKVVVEGVLSGRPVITSDVCPAVNYLPGAVVIVPPDDSRGYADAIKRLADDPGWYRENCLAGRAVGAPFFDPSHSWKTAFESALSAGGLVQPGEDADGRGGAS